MQRVGMVRIVGVFLFLAMANYQGASQSLDIDTKQIEPLIREWNYANNSRNRESFANVYGAQLLFYTQNISESKAIELKQGLFRLRPAFRQRITSDLTYTPYTTGVIKVDFIKEVFEKSGWKVYPSYLLVSYEGNGYRIVGESDYATDKTLKYQLRIGEPMEFATAPGEQNAVSQDSAAAASPSSGMRVLDSIEEFIDSGDWSSVIPPLSSMGVVTIPKGYVFILIGMLATGGLMIFIADSIQAGQRKKRALIQKEVLQQNGISMHNGTVPKNGSTQRGVLMQKPEAGDNVVRAFKMQSVFEEFVVTLFDPLFFRHRRLKVERVHAGKTSGPEAVPDLEFEFNHKETHVRFAIKCLYYKNRGSREVQLFTEEQQRAFREFAEDREMDVYYVVGIGGTPDDPKELYLVPSKAIRTEFVRKEVLRRYWKSGMFFYNSSLRGLQ